MTDDRLPLIDLLLRYRIWVNEWVCIGEDCVFFSCAHDAEEMKEGQEEERGLHTVNATFLLFGCIFRVPNHERSQLSPHPKGLRMGKKLWNVKNNGDIGRMLHYGKGRQGSFFFVFTYDMQASLVYVRFACGGPGPYGALEWTLW